MNINPVSERAYDQRPDRKKQQVKPLRGDGQPLAILAPECAHLVLCLLYALSLAVGEVNVTLSSRVFTLADVTTDHRVGSFDSRGVRLPGRGCRVDAAPGFPNCSRR